MDGIFVRHMTQMAVAKSPSRAPLAVLLLLLFSTGCGSILPQPGPQQQRFSLASLQGNYSYNLGGTIFGLPQGYGLYHESGAFVADGNGGLTGVDDFSSGSTPVSGPLTGSYTVNDDGTGTMTLNAPGRQIQLAITIRSNTEVYLLEVDEFAFGDGGALAQSAPAISAPLSGAYVFRFYTHVVGGASTTAVGRIVVNGTSVTGNEDVSQIGTLSSPTITGALTQPDSNGRGTLTLTDDTGNTSDYVYYVIDSNTLNFVRMDTGVVGEGRGAAQTGTSFSNASINNGFAFHLGGDTVENLGGVNTIGAFTGDGSGNITSGSLDSVVDGVVTTNESFTGTYSVDSSGRASLTLTPTGASPLSEVAWMADSTQGFFLQPAQSSVSAGALTQQQGAPFSAASLDGDYAFRLVGYDATGTAVGVVGVMTFDGNSNVTLANFFVNQGGVQGQNGGLSTSYTVSSNGRAVSGPISGVTNGMVFYITSSTSSYFLLADPGVEIQGLYGIQSPQ